MAVGYGTIALTALVAALVAGATSLVASVVRSGRDLNGLRLTVDERFKHYDEALARHDTASKSVVQAKQDLNALGQKVDERFRHYDQVLARHETAITSLGSVATLGAEDMALRRELRALRRQVRAMQRFLDATAIQAETSIGGPALDHSVPPSAREQERLRILLGVIARAWRTATAKDS